MAKRARRKRKVKYYQFLDVAIDVFFSIILYNAFISFPGLNASFVLMILAVFVMINYWWISRAFVEEPKYYLADLYFVTIVMFLFTIWPNYFSNIRVFALIMGLVFLVDSIFSIVDVPLHEEVNDEPTLKRYFKEEIVVAVYYLAMYFYVNSMTITTLALVIVPYLIYFALDVRSGVFITRFIDEGKQPY